MRDTHTLFEKYDVLPLREGKMIWIRAILNNVLAGWMAFLTDFRENHLVFVSTVVVSPEKQGLGIGELLLRSIYQYWVPASRELTLEVRENNSKAIRFYERLGFVIAPEIECSDDCFAMRWILH